MTSETRQTEEEGGMLVNLAPMARLLDLRTQMAEIDAELITLSESLYVKMLRGKSNRQTPQEDAPT